MIANFSETLVTQECVSCAITFAVTATVERQLRESRRSFQCPNGHSQSYRDVIETERLRAEIEQLKAESARKTERIFERDNEIDRLNRRISSLRGVITKMNARAKLGSR